MHVQLCGRCENARLHRENLFSIFRGHTAFERTCATAFRNQFLAIAGVIIVKNIFESIRNFKVGRRLALKGNRAEASMMKMYVTKCRKWVQARKFRVDVYHGCEVKCNCLAGRHFCNNSMWAVSIVQIRRAIILVEVERNFGLLIKTISREEFKRITQSQLDRKLNDLSNPLYCFHEN